VDTAVDRPESSWFFFLDVGSRQLTTVSFTRRITGKSFLVGVFGESNDVGYGYDRVEWPDADDRLSR
jgi:hypothetical protein